jgi:hypothetical protein
MFRPGFFFLVAAFFVAVFLLGAFMPATFMPATFGVRPLPAPLPAETISEAAPKPLGIAGFLAADFLVAVFLVAGFLVAIVLSPPWLVEADVAPDYG